MPAGRTYPLPPGRVPHGRRTTDYLRPRMSNPNPSPDPPPSISAAELRRRLLASTPPPVAASAASPEPAPSEPTSASQAWNVSQDLLSRLRMQPAKPGSAPVPVAAARSVV